MRHNTPLRDLTQSPIHLSGAAGGAQLVPSAPHKSGLRTDPNAPPPTADAPTAPMQNGGEPPPLSLPLGLFLCGMSLLVQTVVLAAVLTRQLHAPSAALTLAVHAAACALAAWALNGTLTLPRPVLGHAERRAELLFLFTLAFFMPLFGGLGLLTTVLVERRRRRPRPKLKHWVGYQHPELPHQPLKISGRPQYGDGALSALLRYCPNPERRLAAVLSARRVRDANDVAVLRLALTDPVDDVRLLAYSILDRREQAYNARLKALRAQLEAVSAPAQLGASVDPQVRARLTKRVAQTLLEMIHLGMAQGEVETYLLAEARQHVDEALSTSPDDREGLFLQGGIALLQEDLATAERAFLRAQVQGMAIEEVLPQLAEVAFKQRRFGVVTQYLRAISSVYFRAQPQLGGVAAHWLPEEQKW